MYVGTGLRPPASVAVAPSPVSATTSRDFRHERFRESDADNQVKEIGIDATPGQPLGRERRDGSRPIIARQAEVVRHLVPGSPLIVSNTDSISETDS